MRDPQETEQRPRDDRACHVRLIEPRGVVDTVDTVDAGGDLRAANDVRV